MLTGKDRNITVTLTMHTVHMYVVISFQNITTALTEEAVKSNWDGPELPPIKAAMPAPTSTCLSLLLILAAHPVQLVKFKPAYLILMETVREGLQGGITSPEKAAASIKGKDMHRGKRLMDAHS